jgi:hypothetical protein
VPFTRATTATRTNAAGLIELVPYNLLSYSEQFDNALAWGKFNASITANTTTAPNGTLAADKLIPNTISGIHNVNRLLTFTASTTYTTSVYAKKAEYSALRINYISSANTFVSVNLDTGVIANAGGTIYLSSSITDVGDGWYRITMTFTPPIGTSSLSFIVENPVGTISFTGDDTSGIYLWGAQLVEGTAALPYQLTETRLNRPRVDFSLGGCPNLLLEPQRTNLALQSSSFDSATWAKTRSTVTANATTSPSGIVDADKLIPSVDNNNHIITQISIPVTAQIYTASVYAKKGEYDTVRLLLSNLWASPNPNAIFNLTTKTVFSTQNATAKITELENDWFRLEITATINATAGSNAHLIIYAGDNDNVTFAGDGTSGLFIWGAQLEAGAYPTSYVPTSSASVTRNSDTFALSNVFTNNLISSSGGTWFMELRNNIPYTSDSNIGAIFLDTASFGYTDGFMFRKQTSGRFLIQRYIGTIGLTLHATTTDTVKVAIKWNGTTADVFVNGVKVVAATAFAITAMQFLSNSTNPLYANINNTALYNTAISDAECIAITTL